MANSEVIADMPFSTFAQGICTSLVIAQERLHPKEILKECTFFWECLLSKLRRDKLCNNKSLLWFFRKGVRTYGLHTGSVPSPNVIWPTWSSLSKNV